MPPQVYLITSTRSSPSPPPESPESSPIKSPSYQTTSSQVRRRGRNGASPGLTPIRPTFDYSTANSYYAGESTVDNDTTDGDTFAPHTFGRARRMSAHSVNHPKTAPNPPTLEKQEGRALTERRAVAPHRRESPHPQAPSSRGAGPVALTPRHSHLFPDKIPFGALSLDARQTGEYALLNLAVGLAVWNLFKDQEWDVAYSKSIASLPFQLSHPI